MRTPDEIKKGLECCIKGNCMECPYEPQYKTLHCKPERCRDTMNYIRQLEDDLSVSKIAHTVLLDDCAAEHIQQLEAQVPKWISVEERLPERGVEVLGTNGKEVEMCTYWPGQPTPWESWTAFHFKPTHWMPLPEPPKEHDNAKSS